VGQESPEVTNRSHQLKSPAKSSASALEIVHADPPAAQSEELAKGRYLDDLIALVGEGRGRRLTRDQAVGARTWARTRLEVGADPRVVFAVLVAAAVFTNPALDLEASRVDGKRRPTKTDAALARFLAEHGAGR
jgi:hypothetical protein